MTRALDFERRVLERSEDVEWGLCAGCAVAGTPGIAAAISQQIGPDAFSVPAAGIAFDALRRLYDGGHPLTELSFASCYEEIADKKRAEYASMAQNPPFWLTRTGEAVAGQLWGDGGHWADPRSISYLAGRMASAVQMAALRGALSGLLHDSRSFEGTPGEFTTDALRRIMACSPQSESGGVASVGEVVDTVWAKLCAEYEMPPGTLRGMDTGYTRLNEMTMGLRPGQVSVIAAESGHGKSMLAGNIVVNLAINGFKSLVFSLEMDREELVERWLFAESRVSLRVFASRQLTKAQQQRLSDARARIRPMPIQLDPRSDLTVEQIVGMAQMQAAQGGLDVLVVDYAQLVATKPGKSEATREREVAHVSRSLKMCAKSLGIHVIYMSQLNDDGKMRESRALKNDADFVFLLRKATGDAETAGNLAMDGDGQEVEMNRLICKCDKARGTDGTGREMSFLQIPGTTAMVEEQK